jgi:hypothetical protein
MCIIKGEEQGQKGKNRRRWAEEPKQDMRWELSKDVILLKVLVRGHFI